MTTLTITPADAARVQALAPARITRDWCICGDYLTGSPHDCAASTVLILPADRCPRAGECLLRCVILDGGDSGASYGKNIPALILSGRLAELADVTVEEWCEYSGHVMSGLGRERWREAHPDHGASPVVLLRVARRDTRCPECSECGGRLWGHHWIESYQEDTGTYFACKHCDAEGDECPECDGQPSCRDCKGAGVVEVEP